MSLADRIADCALNHYDHGLSTHQRGKPKPESEWTVYAAIVAEHLSSREVRSIDGQDNSKDSRLWVVSCATGTKCTARRVKGCILHDCHAEVLAKRGLQRVLWKERLHFQKALKEGKHDPYPEHSTHLLQPTPSINQGTGEHTFNIRPDLRLHLYISDSPCGDASIYPIPIEISL